MPLLDRAVEREGGDPALAVLGSDAAAIARAAAYLARKYTLTVTNPPFLARSKQSPALHTFVEEHLPTGAPDLAAAFMLRCLGLSSFGGTKALVSPYVWLALNQFEGVRRVLLSETSVRLIAVLGPRAFQTAMWDFSTILTVSHNATPDLHSVYRVVDVAAERTAEATAAMLEAVPVAAEVAQLAQLANPRSLVALSVLDLQSSPLSNFVSSYAGVCNGDSTRFVRHFWEARALTEVGWSPYRSTPDGQRPWSGLSKAIRWDGKDGELRAFVSERLGIGNEAAWLRGDKAWGRRGVTVGLMGRIPVAPYEGEIFDENVAVLIPMSEDLLPALVAYLSSREYVSNLRSINRKVAVKTQYLLRVPFDVDRWRRVAEEAGPLPEPWSDDPTQWLFEGRPEVSTAPLQVAVGRLVGYRWPQQPESDDLALFADADGIVCLPSVAGEAPASDRVQQLLAVTYGKAWAPTRLNELLGQAGGKKTNVADWLRDEFFKQHCALFGNRPFVWQVWDGLRDGFSALVNYHRLDRKTLEKLTYTYLGQDWVERQRAGVRDEVAGAEGRLAAALDLQRKLELIIEGETPFDIFVRWKELHEQSVGWEPDVNDGVRLNVRPFVEAGVLRTSFNIHWNKDRGKNPDGTERENDVHLTLASKLNARESGSRE